MLGDGSESACLDVDECEKNAPVGGLLTLAVGGIAYRRSDIRAIEQEIALLKNGLGLGPDDELKYNWDQNHPSRVAVAKQNLSRRDVITRCLEAVNRWPVHIVGHVVIARNPTPEARVDNYRLALRQSIFTFASAVKAERGDATHQVRIDNPGRQIGRHPYADYQELYRGGLHQLGFSPDLASSVATASGFIQVADLVVGCLAEYVTDKARLVARGSAYRSLGWPRENFQLIARRSFLPGGAIGISVSAPDETLAAALKQETLLDGVLAEEPDQPVPVHVLPPPTQRSGTVLDLDDVAGEDIRSA